MAQVSLQRQIVAHFRATLAPGLNMAPFLLMAPIPEAWPRSWFKHHAERKRGHSPGLPHLLLPVLSQDQAHTCLWLYLAIPGTRITPDQAYVLATLQALGHQVSQVQNLHQAHNVLVNYLVDPASP